VERLACSTAWWHQRRDSLALTPEEGKKGPKKKAKASSSGGSMSGGSCWPMGDPSVLPTLSGAAVRRPVAACRGDRSPFTRTSYGNSRPPK
jgi:hypothetical protein